MLNEAMAGLSLAAITSCDGPKEYRIADRRRSSIETAGALGIACTPPEEIPQKRRKHGLRG